MFTDAASLADRLIEKYGKRGAIALVWERTLTYPTPGSFCMCVVLVGAVLLRSIR